ncbi:cupin domain-containing protein [Candidatus Thorarchaeota archaeon]|nr:MAG: cupin domain-containing protein [Candidatus Thorarchaeota archaeon]
MFVKRFDDCEEIIAIDNTILREILNPRHDQADLHLDYSIAHAIVRSGDSSAPHVLRRSSEVYYILKGRGVMHVDEESVEVGPLDAVYVPPGSRQYIDNIGREDLTFLCIVYPSWRADDEELVD